MDNNEFLWVTIGCYELSGTDKKNIGTHRNLSELIEQTFPSPTTQFLGRRGQMLSLIRSTTQFLVRRGQMQRSLEAQPNFLSEVVRLGLDKEIAPDGTY